MDIVSRPATRKLCIRDAYDNKTIEIMALDESLVSSSLAVALSCSFSLEVLYIGGDIADSLDSTCARLSLRDSHDSITALSAHAI